MNESIEQLTKYFYEGKAEAITDAMEGRDDLESLKANIRVGNRCIAEILLLLTTTQITNKEAAEVLYNAVQGRWG